MWMTATEGVLVGINLVFSVVGSWYLVSKFFPMEEAMGRDFVARYYGRAKDLVGRGNSSQWFKAPDGLVFGASDDDAEEPSRGDDDDDDDENNGIGVDSVVKDSKKSE